MWKLYDDLYIGIPSGVRIDGCVIGENWVTVRANGNIGIARMLEEPKHQGSEYIGKYLRDTGCHLWWKDLTEAAVGVAALNAWYNTPERVAGLKGVCENEYESADNIAVIGCCPGFAKSGLDAKIFDLPMSEEVDGAVYSEIAQADYIVISADAITTKALPALLDMAGEDANVIIDGPSAPASALFFAFDMPVKKVCGVYRRFDNTMEDAALLNLKDIAPGTLPFAIAPQPLARVHEQENIKNFKSSPYKASKFNQDRFTAWQGKEYDHSVWSEIYKG